MGRKSALSIAEEEELAESVRRYLCLYDKSNEDHKNKIKVLNAWQAVDKAMGMEDGESRKAFENLKKRYSKKRSQLKQAKRSGAGKVDVDSYQKELDKYAFLQWLEPFIRLRNDTRTNLTKKEEVKRQEDTEDQMNASSESENSSEDDDTAQPIESQEEVHESLSLPFMEQQNDSGAESTVSSVIISFAKTPTP